MNAYYSKQADAYLDGQTEKQAERIRKAVNDLPSGDVKKLIGIDGYRLRVGKVRILFKRDGDAIHVIKIDNRGDVYK